MATASVIVCTFNRSESLADTLRSLCVMHVAQRVDWELIVVDNNSTDDTRATVERAITEFKSVRLRYLLEKTAGLSHARNAGVRASTGSLIAFTDDDVLVDSDWLMRIVAAFEARQVQCVGGPVRPYWLGQRPRWLTDSLLPVLAMLDYGDSPFEFAHEDHRILFGANFAFRREALMRMGLFNVDLGRKGQFGVGEDKEAFEKLRSMGGRAAYEPAAAVRHKVFQDRMNKLYFRRWYYAAGKARARVRKPSRFRVLGIESHLLIDSARAVTSFIASAVTLQSARFEHELRCIMYFSVLAHKVLPRS